ncbi:MAG TPA: hypothetical protein VH641_19295, partial [Streptosporangiaceae bacterium]
AAGRAGAQVAALGTSPLPVEPEPLRTSRYERLAEIFGLTAHEQLTCGNREARVGDRRAQPAA